jgi:hypothetical protein
MALCGRDKASVSLLFCPLAEAGNFFEKAD